MATLSDEELAFANSLEVEEIPVKLRCGTCNKVAVDAVKLPCCSTSICGACRDILPETCPICAHSPVTPDACTDYKSLRNTIKAHLKTAIKKRDAKLAAAAQPEPTPTPAAEPVQERAKSVQDAIQQQASISGDVSTPAAEDTVAGGEEQDPAGQGEVDNAKQALPQDGQAGENVVATTEGGAAEDEDTPKSDVEIITERPDHDGQPNGVDAQDHQGQEMDINSHDNTQMQDANQGYGFGQGQQAQGGMGYGNMQNFNPMMMMGGMGMPSFNAGMPNMMGQYKHPSTAYNTHSRLNARPGMQMDPTMMFNQFGGMNGMNGMNDMSMMNMGIMGAGGFGSNGGMGGMNQGFGGYNQFGSGMNQHHNNNFSHNNRGFGRPYGRGFNRGNRGFVHGRGRAGGWGQNQYGYHQNFQQNQDQYAPQNPNFQMPVRQMSHQQEAEDVAESNGPRGSPAYEQAGGDANDSNLQARQPDAEGQDGPQNAGDDRAAPDTNGDAGAQQDTGRAEPSYEADDVQGGADFTTGDGYQGNGDIVPQFDETGNPNYNYAPAFYNQNGFNNSSAYQQPEPVRASTPPPNAPTGPKAMREGKPNSGYYSRPQVSRVSDANGAASERAGGKDQPPQRDPSAERVEHTEHTRGRTESRERDRYRDRKQSHRSRDDDYESDETHSRRKEKERRKRKDRERKYEDDDVVESASKKARSRSASPDDDSGRRRHRRRDEKDRSRHDRSRERRRSHRDDVNGDEDSSRRKSKSHRSSRDDADHKDRSSRRSSKYHDDEESSRKDRSSRHHSHRERAAPIPEDDEIGFKIKGSNKANKERNKLPPSSRSNSRRGSTAQEPVKASDPYAEERERFKQERAAKDALRRQGGGLGKHGREEEETTGSSRKRRDRKRNVSSKYEDEVPDGEKEREMGRWR